MRKNIKRLSLVLLTLGLSSPAFADVCNPFNVTVPNQNGGFTIAADALYLRPSVDFNNNTGAITTTGATTNGSISNIDPNYKWGFDVSAGYRIPGTGNDVTATWTHLEQNSDSDTVTLPNVFIPAVEAILPGGLYNFSATGSLQFNYDAVDLDVGQRINFGDYFQYRVFTGVRWTQMEADKDTISSATLVTPSIPGTSFASSSRIEQDNKFNGVGPQVGMDGRYCLGYGFGIDANLTASLLIGDTDNDSRAISAIAGVPVPGGPTLAETTTVNLEADNKTRVVPAIDASLGLDYTYNFNNCDRSNIVVQAGWKVINYFDAAERLNDADIIALLPSGSTGTVNPGNGRGGSRNIAFQGPYAGIKINM